MNPVEYLITGLLVVMAIGVWVLVHAIRHSDDGFENELGFQFGVPPSVKSLDAPVGFVPVAPPRAVVPDLTTVKPRRPPGSKPPMLPVNLSVSDLDPRPTATPWPSRQLTEPSPSISAKSPPDQTGKSSGPPAKS